MIDRTNSFAAAEELLKRRFTRRASSNGHDIKDLSLPNITN